MPHKDPRDHEVTDGPQGTPYTPESIMRSLEEANAERENYAKFKDLMKVRELVARYGKATVSAWVESQAKELELAMESGEGVVF